MPKKEPIKRLRFQQLYAQGLPTTKIAKWFLTSPQAVSKLIKPKGNPELRQQHTASRTLNRKLSGESLPERMPMRVKELYALGLNIERVSLLLAVPPPDVFMLVDDDAEVERLHAARVALDRKLANREPVTEADFIADQAAPLPDADRGELAPNGAQAAVGGAAPTEEIQPPDEQPADEHSEEVQPEVVQPLEDATDEHSEEEIQPPELPRSAPEAETNLSSKTLSKMSTEAETTDTAATMHLVLKHVGAEYRFQPDQLTSQEDSTPPQWWQPQPSKDELQLQEARQVVVFIALRVAGLSRGQLAAVLGCDFLTILHADSEAEAIFLADYARRNRILGIELRIRQEARLTPSAQP